MVFRKWRFRWVRFHIEISKVTGPNFTGLVSPKAGGIAVEVLDQFRISSFDPEIFASERRSRPKSSQIFQVFCPLKFFGGGPPKFWTGIIKLGLVLTALQNFTPIGRCISEISRRNKK